MSDPEVRSSSTPRVGHVIPWYAPESWGGTEQYVANLAADAMQLGVSSVIVVPGSDPAEIDSQWQGTRVLRVPRDQANGGSALLVRRLLDERVTVMHVHAWTPVSGLELVEQAAAAGIRTVLTLHVPSIICARGTMMRLGTVPCDGIVVEQKCARCWLDHRGAPPAIAGLLSMLPSGVSGGLSQLFPASRAAHAAGAVASVTRRKRELASLGTVVDVIVAPCRWLFDACAANGIASDKLVLCRQGVDSGWRALLQGQDHPRESDTLQILFVGRWDPLKGIGLLVRAFRAAPRKLPMRLVIACAAAANPDAASHRDEVLELIGDDSRIVLREGSSRAQLAGLFGSSDALAVPSQCYETGPLVVLEGLAAGCHILGSKLGGIAELLEGRSDADLLAFNDMGAWSAAIGRVPRRACSPGRAVGTAVRSSLAVAEDMVEIYRRLVVRPEPVAC